MKKAYYLLFYKIYLFWKSIYDDGLSDWKALIVVTALQGLLIVECYVWSTILLKKDSIEIVNPKIIFFLIALFISICNYRFLLHNNQWKFYAEEFNNHSKKKKIITSWLTFVFFVFILASIVFAFYQMSLIDWSKYR